MYACSPRWENLWMDKDLFRFIVEKLASFSSSFYRGIGNKLLGVNYGFHLTGGEPFLNFPLLLSYVEIASKAGLPSIFVETNCFWCISDEIVEDKLTTLREAGLHGILISVNPFMLEYIDFRNVKRCFRIAVEIFGSRNTMMYHPYFYRQAEEIGVKERLRFEDYLKIALAKDYTITDIINPWIILPMGRLCYRLDEFYNRKNAESYFGERCLDELTRAWHVHIDCYGNYIPGYCGGLTLGDIRMIDDIVDAGVDLSDKPVLEALSTDIRRLYEMAVEGYGYKPRDRGYISRCHLCLDIRRHLALEVGGFKELQPIEFYKHI